MSRIPVPFETQDVSALARNLNRALAECEHAPSHLQLLNMLVRSAGYKNFQHFRAQQEARGWLEQPPSPPPSPAPVDHLQVARVARHFDAQGRLTRWPGKASHQQLCLWALWAALPAGQPMSEAQLNAVLLSLHCFGDHALLRRLLFDSHLVTRTPDCRVYRRLERRPPPEALALIRHLGLRRQA
ncbi:DUF2087 domain-containing protein [Megalodesulfovibrio paquesii]